ncbi:MAG: aminotransferase class V-fold PLP-dependent enzyme [Pseudomonadota bacterium]
MTAEKAELGQMHKHLSQLGIELDKFLKFEHPDALVNRDRWYPALKRPLPEQGVGLDQVMQELAEHVIPNGSPVVKPGFSGYIVTGATSASVLATTAAGIASPVRYLPIAFNLLEEMSLEWLAEMCGLSNMKGIYSSGGSVANLLAIGAARQSAFEKVGHDPARDGVDRPVSIYTSTECHHTIQRSAGVLGMGRRCVVPIDCDDRGRIDTSALNAAIEKGKQENRLPIAIVANAGTTNTGAIDPLREIGQIAKAQDIWMHVDGAYGLPGILDPRLSHLYDGLELADSAIVDPHKWLGAGAGIAATFVHDRDLLERAFTQEAAAYLEGSLKQDAETAPSVEHSMDDFGIPYFNYGVELTSPCRGVAMWAMIREIGVEGMRDRIIRHNDMAREIAKRCTQHEILYLLLQPTLSICCFRYTAPEISDLNKFNQRLYRRLVRENEFLPSTTLVADKLAIRPCFVGARTDSEQVNGMLESILRIGDALVSEQG